MSDVMDIYRSKLISAEDAAAMVKSNDTVDYYAFTASSQYFDAALAQRAGELENVRIRSELRVAPPMQALLADTTGRAFYLESLFRGPIENFVPVERSTAIPARLSEYEKLFRDGYIGADFAAFMVSPPDNDGYLHFCPSPGLAKADAEMAGCFFAEINETYFPMRGTDDCKIHISKVGHVIEGANPPMFPVPDPPASEVDAKIADAIMGQLCDGACIQIGYGSVPMAAVNLIAESDLKDLGIHTEVLSDGIMRLCKAGRVTGAKKTTDRGKVVAGILLGSTEFYNWVRDCPDVYGASSSYTNNPNVMSQNDNLVTVNACLEVDLTGQINAESIGARLVSGTGGQLDFMIGTMLSKNGKAILCCPSTYPDKQGKTRSRIVSRLTLGAAVTTPRSCVQYIATEYGIVNLRGRNGWERSELLISIAHPDFREELIKEADALQIWRNRNRG